MFRMPKRKEIRYTAPDHRPMLPEFRLPEDSVAEAVREIHSHYAGKMPEKHMKWR